MIIFFLLALPARVMALSIHEWAHAWAAYKCGDPTARMMGRMTLNPAAHLDLVGTIMMALLGFGWAKPVPVNPRNFRNYRRDDIIVSLAGITMNLILFLVSTLVCAVVLIIAIGSSAPGLPMNFVVTNAPLVGHVFVESVWGRMAGYIFEMLQYFVLVNISLAVFNLIPVPPLDGSHVLANLLPRNPFRNPRVGQIAYLAMLALLFTGALGDLLSYVTTWAIQGVGSAVYALLHLIGVA